VVFAYSIRDDKNYSNVTQVDLSRKFPFGTALVKSDGSRYHYASAAEDLQPGALVEPGLSDEDRFTLAFSRKMEEFADIVYGKVVATVGDPGDKPGILGCPVVQVKKGYCFWIREVPAGATLENEMVEA